MTCASKDVCRREAATAWLCISLSWDVRTRRRDDLVFGPPWNAVVLSDLSKVAQSPGKGVIICAQLS